MPRNPIQQVQPHLIDVALPRHPQGIVLVLHGGASRRGRMMVSPTQLSVLRMIPIARRIARVGRGRLAVFRLLNAVRGWDTHRTPVHDALWALDQARARLGPALPICLVGHSLGGRAALLTAGRTQVRSVVALNPWLYPDDGGGLAETRVLIVHGTHDRIASPERSAAVARNLSRTTQVTYVPVEGGRHAMLRHHAEFGSLAAGFVTATLLGDRKPLERGVGRPTSELRAAGG